MDYDEDYIKSLLKIYRNHIPKINLYNDAKDIIDTLYNRNLKLGIITDGYVETQKNKLKVLNINNYFDYILITDELGKEYWKPHRKPYDIMKEQLNVCYEEMVYIGDNVSKDFVTPNKLGMKSIMINRMDRVYKNNINIDKIYMPQLIVNNLNEIGGIV
ncbi:Pyrophosphatase PpaX [bioreactor metagenome]|uniref:Pyrophosphatase PpaX n=1 Tax=bioreactor metagenome TaxID=1076179 RepID=A0A645BMX2_9ZZZZ